MDASTFSVWLLWRPNQLVTADTACVATGTIRLFSNETDAQTAQRAYIRDDYYAVADRHFTHDGDRDPRAWVKTSAGTWRLRDESDATEEAMFDLLDSSGFDHSHPTTALLQVPIESTAAHRSPFYVATIVTCCDECSADEPQFKVSADKSVVDTWLNEQLREKLETAVSELSDVFYKKFADAKWCEGNLIGDCDCQVEFERFNKAARFIDEHVCPIWWDVAHVTVSNS